MFSFHFSQERYSESICRLEKPSAVYLHTTRYSVNLATEMFRKHHFINLKPLLIEVRNSNQPSLWKIIWSINLQLFIQTYNNNKSTPTMNCMFSRYIFKRSDKYEHIDLTFELVMMIVVVVRNFTLKGLFSIMWSYLYLPPFLCNLRSRSFWIIKRKH